MSCVDAGPAEGARLQCRTVKSPPAKCNRDGAAYFRRFPPDQGELRIELRGNLAAMLGAAQMRRGHGKSGVRVGRGGPSASAHPLGRTVIRRKGAPEADAARDRNDRQARSGKGSSILLSVLTKCGVCGAGFIMGSAGSHALRRSRRESIAATPARHPTHQWEYIASAWRGTASLSGAQGIRCSKSAIRSTLRTPPTRRSASCMDSAPTFLKHDLAHAALPDFARPQP